jgi:hypothetical protein
LNLFLEQDLLPNLEDYKRLKVGHHSKNQPLVKERLKADLIIRLLFKSSIKLQLQKN